MGFVSRLRVIQVGHMTVVTVAGCLQMSVCLKMRYPQKFIILIGKITFDQVDLLGSPYVQTNPNAPKNVLGP